MAQKFTTLDKDSTPKYTVSPELKKKIRKLRASSRVPKRGRR